MEIWKTINGFDDYQVSNYGRVARKPDRPNGRGFILRERILKQTPDRHGYLGVFLFNKDGGKKYPVHRLVANAFITNPCKHNVVNHIDCNIKNNHIDNLEWCTCAENTAHAVKMGRFSTLPTCKPVIQLSLSGEYIAEHPSLHEASRRTSLTFGNIGSACRRRKTAGGFRWLYKSEYNLSKFVELVED